MSDYCVIVTGGAHARFFTLEPVEFPELESGPRLIERGELFNPEKEIAERDLYTDSKMGRGRVPLGGPAHGYDDHRSKHDNEFDRRFARKVSEKASSIAQANQARYLILVAPAHMLGLIRQELDIICKHDVKVHILEKDMTKFLARAQMLPPLKRPGI
ncbi:MAG: host attachment protein [Deltaproteobacteria bacterium]|nr:host attachment protein [Deltaproteobacteria bacterium]